MDVTLFATAEEITVRLPYEDATVTVRYLTPADRAAIRRKLTVLAPGADGLEPDLDMTRFYADICAAAVTGWEGITVNGAPWPCTPDNVRALSRDNQFFEIVNSACYRIEAFRKQEQDTLEKN